MTNNIKKYKMNNQNSAHSFTEGAEFNETHKTMNTEKKIHFRLIELPEHQVLLTKDFDEESEESKPLLVISFFHNGIKANIKFGFKSEENVDEAFNKFTATSAQTLIDNALNQFG